MGNLISDEDFVMILITSLLESWDNYTSSYLGSSGNKPELKSHELVAMLMEEDRCRKHQIGNLATSLWAKEKGKGKTSPKSDNSDKEC